MLVRYSQGSFWYATPPHSTTPIKSVHVAVITDSEVVLLQTLKAQHKIMKRPELICSHQCVPFLLEAAPPQRNVRQLARLVGGGMNDAIVLTNTTRGCQAMVAA